MKKKVSIICPYPLGEAPSQRFRFEIFDTPDECEFSYYPFWSNKAWKILYQDQKNISKAFHLLLAYSKRFLSLLSLAGADLILIHREATPIGPPIIEWILAKVMRKKIIYDFDDAIWLPNRSEANKKYTAGMKFHSKVSRICTWSKKVSVGNSFLANYASAYNKNVIILPTVVDTIEQHDPQVFPKRKNNIPVIGWTGSHSTLKQLEPLWPLLDNVQQENPFNFLLISDHFPEDLPNWVKCLRWNKESEIEDLMQIDIGIMPLKDSDWEKGKCAFKLIQYMALEKASVASAVGANKEVVLNKDQAFLLKSTEEWTQALKKLISDPLLRKEMGTSARQRIIEAYSKEAQQSTFDSLFKEVTV